LLIFVARHGGLAKNHLWPVSSEVAISRQLGYFCDPLGVKNRRGGLDILWLF